ncbi:hypothetical protein BDP27DRAFT_1369131 [Rhodocollybia butyracea]|uniref:Uncharacterized protein n=1 Tax=Rhodocollybia butyracea TaxID=206335 RepID=A0A9P5PH98_9AGAR|nr:hypothetical protein BDP27DRAFT_1369131 [Rhodocollybia butyracea]
MLKKPPLYPATLKRRLGSPLGSTKKASRISVLFSPLSLNYSQKARWSRVINGYEEDDHDEDVSEILCLRSKVHELQGIVDELQAKVAAITIPVESIKVEVGVQCEQDALYHPSSLTDIQLFDLAFADFWVHSSYGSLKENDAWDGGTELICPPPATAPAWFHKAFFYVNCDFGPQYAELIRRWMHLEELNLWKNSRHGLSDLNRPTMLDDWRKRRAGAVPALFTVALVQRFFRNFLDLVVFSPTSMET